MGYRNLDVEVKDNVLYLTMNNPATLNALSIEMTEDMKNLIYDYGDGDEIRAIVLRGANGVFSGGGDVKAMKWKIENNQRNALKTTRRYKELILAMRNCPKPIIGYLENTVAGAGLSLAMACDYSIINKDAKCVFAFVNIGYIPDLGNTMFLARNVGKAKATELLMLGNRFTGEEGAKWGMFNEAVDKEELPARVEKMVKKFANGPTMAYTRMKYLMNKAVYEGLDKLMDLESDYQQQLAFSDDHTEAVMAFFDKRKPNFTGK